MESAKIITGSNKEFILKLYVPIFLIVLNGKPFCKS